MSDVHQVHQKLVVGRGVVLAVDLSVAGEAALALQAQIPGRKHLRVPGGDLRAFRAGTDDRDIAAEDVEELRQLIKTASAHEAPDLRDAGIAVSGGETGDTVLLSVHPHAAKFQQAERLSVLGEPGLSVEHGPAVGCLDDDREDQHQRPENRDGDRRKEDVEESLEEEIFRRRVVALDHHHREVHKMQRHRAAHDDVADPRKNVGRDIVLDTVFDDLVPVVAVEIAEEDDLNSVQNILRAAFSEFADRKHPYHFKVPVEAAGMDQPVDIRTLIIDHRRFLCGEVAEIPAVRPDGPAGEEHDLHTEGQKQRKQRDHPAVDHADYDPEQAVCDQSGQRLAVDQLGDSLDVDQKSVVEMRHQIIENEEEADHNPVSLLEERECHRALVVEVPCEGKSACHKQNVQQFDHPGSDALPEALLLSLQKLAQCNPLISHIEFSVDLSV